MLLDRRPSDWPASLLVDEIWLRSRRVLVHRLEEMGVWPESSQHAAFMKEQKTQGERLKTELLRPALGDDDYAYMASESVFGSSNVQFRRKLSYVASFGYEIGACFSSLHDADPTTARPAAEICALFNVGISIFDLLFDNFPETYAEFAIQFGEDVLSELGRQNDAPTHFRRAAENISATEARILAKLVAEFFAMIHLNFKGRQTADQRRFGALLLDAYRAEARSDQVDSIPSSTLVEHCRAKSTLPFDVMSEVAGRLASRRSSSDAHHAVVRNVATLFWLVDDIVDITRDARNRNANSILAAATDCLDLDVRSDTYSVLNAILDGDYVEQTTDRIASCLSEVNDALQMLDLPCEVVRRNQTAIQSYVRHWID
jgi:hypothetical protein